MHDRLTLVEQLHAIAPAVPPDRIRFAVRRAVEMARAANEPITSDTVVRYAEVALTSPDHAPAVGCDVCGCHVELADFAPLPYPTSPRRAMCRYCGAVRTLASR
jgi:hypothetical protein